MNRTKLSEIAEIIMGQSPKGDSYNQNGDGYPLLNGAADYKGQNFNPKKFTNKPTRLAQKGDILLGIRATIGNFAFADDTYCIGRGVAALRIDDNVADKEFIIRCVEEELNKILHTAAGSTIKGIKKDDLTEMLINFPPLETQKKIAAILDAADSYKQKTKALIEKYDQLTQSLFLDMFGNPVTNPKRWKLRNIRNSCEKFCDGPFGSNLKSEHYVMSGVRIVRLQNIGVGVFNDENKIYIKQSHAFTLKNNHCLPGDILIGTMGMPNLRACILPDNIPIAVNKADCLICRPKRKVFNTIYLKYLLNNNSFVRSLYDLILGQTRGRISMGRLATKNVIAPPIEHQQKFAERVQAIEAQKAQAQKSLQQADNLFNSLLQKAFKGELV